MSIIGIDFSIKSPGITILFNNEYIFFSFPRNSIIKKNIIDNLSKYINLTIIDDEKLIKINNSKNINEREKYLLDDCNYLTNTILNKIKDYLNQETKIIIEGISFASKGNSKIQFSGYHYILRYKLFKEYNININNILVFSPKIIKKIAGGGNFDKNNMINSFLNNNDIILKKNNFYNYLMNNQSLFQTKNKTWIKPIDDIIDSYWTLKSGINYLINYNFSINF